MVGKSVLKFEFEYEGEVIETLYSLEEALKVARAWSLPNSGEPTFSKVLVNEYRMRNGELRLYDSKNAVRFWKMHQNPKVEYKFSWTLFDN